MLTIGTIVMGVQDLPRAMRFWSAALGYKTKSAPEDDWVILVPENGGGAHLALGTSETPVQLHPRIHLDLYAEDQEAEIERLLELGAERVAWDLYPPGEEVDFVVLADPEGNRFCGIDTNCG